MNYELSLTDYLSIVRRRFWWFAIPFVLIAAAGIAFAVVLPPIYQATGKILVESQQIPTELVRSTVTGLADERIQIIRQRVMTRQNLSRVIDKFNLFPDNGTRQSLSQQVDLMRERITLDLVSSQSGNRRSQSTIAFSLSYEDRSPEQALKVTNELVTLYLDENVRTRTERASETTDFLKQESEKLRRGLETLETQIADYKQRNSQALPEQLDMHLNMLERSESELKSIEAERKALEEELRFLRIELAGAQAGMANNIQDQASLSPSQQLAQAKSQLVTLRVRYSDTHPDVVKLKAQIDGLEKAIAPESERQKLETELIAAQARRSALASTYASDNPELITATQQVTALEQEISRLPADSTALAGQSEFDLATARLNGQIAAAEARISVFDQVKSELKTRVQDLQSRILQTPEVERGLTALGRDYENSLTKYEEIRAKQLEAQLAENLEEGRKAERFLLLEPPVLPEQPTKPNRKKIIMFSLLGAAAAGGGLLVLIEMLFGGITSPAILTQIMRQAPLAVIPTIKTKAELARRRRKLQIAAAAVPMTAVCALVAVHFLYMPLDLVAMKLTDRF